MSLGISIFTPYSLMYSGRVAITWSSLRKEFNSCRPCASTHDMKTYTCLLCLAIHAADLPSSSGTGSRLGMYLLIIVLCDKRGAGILNLDSPATIKVALYKEGEGNKKCCIGWAVPSSCIG